MLNRQITALQKRSRLHDVGIAITEDTVQLRELIRRFCSNITRQSPSTYRSNDSTTSVEHRNRDGIPRLSDLKREYESGGPLAIEEYLIKKFALFVSVSVLTPAQVYERERLGNMALPSEWYPNARSVRRKLYLHVGPTNSGKTYQALKRLEQSESGIFAGPLRLLAHEVYERFTSAGVPCNLLTGEERRSVPEARITSCTIEMLSHRACDVLVIDEIQMIGDRSRGQNWTSALLGSAAKEIHMCGEASAVPLIRKIAESVGEEVEVREYSRLGGLEVMDQSLNGSLAKVEPGDAVVTFSRRTIFSTKKAIEQLTGRKCAVIYGALPPETRAAQARLFNDPDSGYDVMVASDAIGMGLNLSIKRVVFSTVQKWDGIQEITVPIPQIKQIAGRAGRFKAKPKVVDGEDPVKDVPGFVTTLRKDDLEVVRDALATSTIMLPKALLSPPMELVQSFFRLYGKDVKRSLVLEHLEIFSRTSELYRMVPFSSRVKHIDLLDGIEGLRFADAWTLSDAPIKRDAECVRVFVELAKKLGKHEAAPILELTEMNIDILDGGAPETPEGLQSFESLHAQIILYLWLAQRFPGVFVSLIEALQLKMLTEQFIEEGLAHIKAKRAQKTLPMEPILRSREETVSI
ncbi:P-loop containing nucleoside triphosphate hydrolase protein [Protomyces lactucae-debilis]|uniref:RNA helicase n=1 Tax=Protomyces lactucae-debilis TaxID=2754530 RepID=A0A1Y2FF12_PROLT|nr:P-loop containing nucleoside triphosphate hydrolase protein [Protomyces lactucae-debilis]ORY81415.1 P-loop containing nucleoside triphosphate hydrolase protein [Protomyces lactucae-debilis]